MSLLISKPEKKDSMNVIDKLYTEWAWRSKTGIPNINNSEDKAILDALISELNVKEEPVIFEGSDSYDNVITAKLKKENLLSTGGGIPLSKNSYRFNGRGGKSFYNNVKGEEDKKIWNALWDEAPPAAKTGTASKGVGAGELSLYWLYNYSNSNINVTEGREGGGADLFFDGVGVEVKAEGSHTSKIGLGRFSEFKEEVSLLTILFGLNALTKVLSSEELEGKILNPTNFLGKELPQAFQSFSKFSNLPNLEELARQFSIFNSIYSNVNQVKQYVGKTSDPTAAAGIMLAKLLSKKLNIKPGFGGYLVNLKKEGSMAFFQIDREKLKEHENVLNHTTIQQSKIGLNYSKVFGI